MATISFRKRDYIDPTKYLVEYLGTSAEVKPTSPNLKLGSTFLEIDTGNVYFYTGAEWIKPNGGGGGGGGDSLIKTANVKVNYTLPEGVDEVTFYNFQQLTISNSDNNPMVTGITYSDTYIPLTELGTPELLKIPICDNGFTNLLALQFSNDLYMDSWSVVSGDATASEYTLNVYGDCEVNMTLAINEP